MSTAYRDPYPYPRYENDDNFCGSRYTQQEPYTMPSHIAQKQDPWERLNSTSTLSSSRREVYHHDPKAPRDGLDFVLKSTYNQHKEFLKAKNETLVQKETLNEDHGRILKNRQIAVPPDTMHQNHPLRIYSAAKKESIHSCKKAIEGHHTQTTNRGYSRKTDGGFFNS